MAVRLLRSVSHWSQRRAASQSPLRLGLLPLPREEFRQLKLILHSELRRRAASRWALPCPSSLKLFSSISHFHFLGTSFSLYCCTLSGFNKCRLWLVGVNRCVKSRRMSMSELDRRRITWTSSTTGQPQSIRLQELDGRARGGSLPVSKPEKAYSGPERYSIQIWINFSLTAMLFLNNLHNGVTCDDVRQAVCCRRNVQCRSFNYVSRTLIGPYNRLKGVYTVALRWKPFSEPLTSLVIWDYTVLLVTRHKWTRLP